MPRNGSGVYNLPPSVNPVVTQTLITSNWANTTMNDLAAAITGSLARNGESPMLNNLPMGGFEITGLHDPTTLQSAATLGFVQNGSHYRLTSVTGTNDITATLIGGSTAFQNGQLIQMTGAVNNTGPMTININGAGVTPLLSPIGQPLGPTNVQAGKSYFFQYQAGTGWVMIFSPNQTAFMQSSISGWDRPTPNGAYPAITKVNANTVNIPGGTGRIIHPSARDQSGVTEVTWVTQNVVLTNLSTAWSTTLGVNAAGAIVQLTGTPDPAWTRQYIILGTVGHADGVIETVNKIPVIYGDGSYAAYDLNTVFKNRLISGGRLGQAVNPLHINIAAGKIWLQGGTPDTVNSPNFVSFPLQTDILFYTATGNNTIGAATQTVPVGNYDPNGAGVIAPIPGSPTTAVVHRLYNLANQYILVYGQQTYANLQTALSLIAVDDSVYNPPSRLQDATFLGYVVMQANCVAVNDGTTGQLVNAGGQSIVIGSAGSISEAPLDGRTYGRNSAAWVTAVDTVVSGPSSTVTIDNTNPNKPKVDVVPGNLVVQGGSLSPANGGNNRLLGASALTIACNASFRNKLINGNFNVMQRYAVGGAQSLSSFNGCYLDRWKYFVSGSTAAVAQSPFVAGQGVVPNEPRFFMRTTVTSVAGSTNAVCVSQYIEDVRTFAGKTVVLSFWARSDANRNMAVELSQYFGTSGSATINGIGSQTVALIANTWTKYSIPVNIPSLNGKTIDDNSGINALSLTFWFDAGSSYNSRTANLGQQSGTFDISQVQLEEGSVATQFELRPIKTELALCQRYFYKSYSVNVSPGSAVTQSAQPVRIDFLGVASNTQTIRSDFKVTMRANPTITTYDDAGTAGKCSYYSGGGWLNGGSISSITFNQNGVAFTFLGLTNTTLGLELNYTAEAEF